MKSFKEKTIADVVTDNIETAHVFKKYGIDFCCGGSISVARACERKKIDVDTLEQEIVSLAEKRDEVHDFKNWDLDVLATYIIDIHHRYVAESIPLILEYAHKVSKVHGAHYTEVVEIDAHFKEISDELSAHMKKEEQILFPYIIRLSIAAKNEEYISPPPFRTVQNPIQIMHAEHEHAGKVMHEISTLSNAYTPPEGACNTFKALYNKLKEFENNLHQHIHLENNILFPKAIALEQRIQI